MGFACQFSARIATLCRMIKPTKPSTLFILLAVALILLFGLFVRLWHIDRESFWADEGWSMVLSKGPTLSDVAVTMVGDQHPPLYFMLLRLWMNLFDNSEILTRLLSTFWSLFGIAVVYRLGADWFSPGAGLAAALLLALTDNDIMLAREVRHYTQMAALTALSSLFYLRYVRRPSRASGIGWVLVSVALLYTHYLGVLALAAQFAHTLLCARPTRRLIDVLARFAAIGAAWLPWALVFIEQSSWRYTRPIIFQSGLPNTPETFSLVRNDLIGSHFGLTGGLLLLGLLYVAYRDGVPRFRLRPLLPTLYLALWLIVPIAAIVIINTRFEILTTRNFLIVTPVIAVLIGHGLTNLDRTARTLALCVLIVVSLITVDAYHIKPPWREVAQDILRYRQGDEPVLMDVWVDDFALRYHIGRDLNADPATLPLVSLPEWRERYGADFFAYLLEYLRGKPALWLAYWGKNEDKLLDWLPEQGFIRTATQIETHLGNQIFVYRYDRPPDTTVAQFGAVIALRSWAIHEPHARALRVNLLFEAVQPSLVDYSVSVFLLDASGTLVAQHDGPPFGGRSPTTGWQPGGLYFDSHQIDIPTSVPHDEYTLGVKIYWYADPQPVSVNGRSYLRLTTVQVGSETLD